MSVPVAVVDYGMGNLFSVARALEACGAEVSFVESPQAVREAERLLLPGVGAFCAGMRGLRERGLVEPLREYAAGGRPLLAICLGMQMLLDVSEEFGRHAGLSIIPGRVVQIPRVGGDGLLQKIPHIGWNELLPATDGQRHWEDSILKGIPAGAAAYFVHSYNAVPEDPEHRLADCYYGGVRIAAALRRGSVYGCQFHPEKSGRFGLQILSNFLQIQVGLPPCPDIAVGEHC